MLKKIYNFFSCFGEFCTEWGDTITVKPITTESIENYKNQYHIGSIQDESIYSVLDTRNDDPTQVDSEAIRQDWVQVGLFLQESMDHVRGTN